jgi:TonB family protein
MSSGQGWHAVSQPATGPQNDLLDKLAEVANRAKTFTAASGASFALTVGEKFVAVVTCGSAPETGATLPLPRTFAGFRSLKSNVFRCNDTDKELSIDSATCRAARIKSMLVAPVGSSSVHGVLAVFSSSADAFTDTHVAVLKTLAEVVEHLLPAKEKLGDLLPEKKADDLLEHPFDPAFDDLPKKVEVGSSSQPGVSKPANASATATSPSNIGELLKSFTTKAPSAPAEGKRPAAHTHKAAVVPPLRKNLHPSPPKTEAGARPPAKTTSYDNVLNLAADPVARRAPSFAKPHGNRSAVRSSTTALEERKDSRRLYAFLVGLVAVGALGSVGYSHFRGEAAKASDVVARPSRAANQRSEVQVPTSPSPGQDHISQVKGDVISAASAAILPRTASAYALRNEEVTPPKANGASKARAASREPIVVSRPARESTTHEEGPPEVQVSGGPTSISDVLNSTSTPAVFKTQQVVASKLVSMVPPIYPENAKRFGIQGRVVISAKVSRNGFVQDVRAVSGPAMLQQAAVNAVKKWRYKPALSNGEPVDSTVEIVLNFTGPR